MGKTKKALHTNLMTRTVLYSALTLGAIVGLAYLLTWGLIYAGIFFGTYIGTGFTVFQSFPFWISLFLLSISATTINLGLKNGRQLWAQWQRRAALAEEEKRVSRLIDMDVLKTDDEQSDESQKNLKENLR